MSNFGFDYSNPGPVIDVASLRMQLALMGYEMRPVPTASGTAPAQPLTANPADLLHSTGHSVPAAPTPALAPTTAPAPDNDPRPPLDLIYGPRPKGTPGRGKFQLDRVLGLTKFQYRLIKRVLKRVCIQHHLNMTKTIRFQHKHRVRAVCTRGLTIFPEFQHFDDPEWPMISFIHVILKGGSDAERKLRAALAKEKANAKANRGPPAPPAPPAPRIPAKAVPRIPAQVVPRVPAHVDADPDVDALLHEVSMMSVTDPGVPSDDEMAPEDANLPQVVSSTPVVATALASASASTRAPALSATRVPVAATTRAPALNATRAPASNTTPIYDSVPVLARASASFLDRLPASLFTLNTGSNFASVPSTGRMMDSEGADLQSVACPAVKPKSRPRPRAKKSTPVEPMPEPELEGDDSRELSACESNLPVESEPEPEPEDNGEMGGKGGRGGRAGRGGKAGGGGKTGRGGKAGKGGTQPAEVAPIPVVPAMNDTEGDGGRSGRGRKGRKQAEVPAAPVEPTMQEQPARAGNTKAKAPGKGKGKDRQTN